ncbi:TBC1 domain family member 23, partial [Armadillidium nasatum]
LRLLTLESALHDGCEFHELINITRGRKLPEEHRAQIWYICLGGGNKLNNFSQFDEIFDLPEQGTIRANCKTLVDKLGNDEDDKVPLVCDTESIFTYYCKSRHLKFDPSKGWSDILIPLLAVKMPRDHIYICFEEILEKYIPRETEKGSPIFHLIRLLLLYHDPELTTFLDSKKITPDLFCTLWIKSLFSSVCTLNEIMPLWDIYFQERDQFFIVFLVLVILMNARDQIISMLEQEQSREKIIETLTNIPTALNIEDIPDFCSLARYYALKTPNTFKKEFSTLIFGSVYMGNSESENFVGNLPLSQALCLPVSSQEILEITDMVEEAPDGIEQVGFFLVDCRPSEQYNAGHLPNAFHLDSNLMLQQPTSFQTAVQGLFMAQRQALASGTPGCGKHLCFIGSGREAEDQYVHMVVASFLQRKTQYVSLAKGGYQAFHSLLAHNLDGNLADHDSKKCIVCSPESESSKVSESGDYDSMIITNDPLNTPQDSLLNKFSSISTLFKSKSSEMKGKLVDYITNPNGSNTPVGRHVNPKDKGKLYKSPDVFSIQEDEDDTGRGREDEKNGLYELVDVSQFMKNSEIVHSFKCNQVRENGYMFSSHLLLTENLMYVIKEAEDRKNQGYITARRTLASIVKITSKKKHPDLITFKYGSTLPDGDITITDMDRFLIPNASEATKTIKELIMKLIEVEKT